MKAYDIEYSIKGSDLQFVEITLEPGQQVYSEPGSMMYMQQGVQMSAKISDGSEKNSGVLGSIIGAGKRMITGENVFLAFYKNNSSALKKVAFASEYPGKITPVNLADVGGKIYCQKGSFLCSTMGTALGIGFVKKFNAGFFGGEGFILQKVEGTGTIFIHACGTVEEIELAKGETMYVDTGSLVGFQNGVDFDIEVVRGFRNMLFAGEDLFLTKLTGPGKVWMQSIPYKRFVANIYNTMLRASRKKN
jgi:uncharacterized protein (TIGR00266 family)